MRGRGGTRIRPNWTSEKRSFRFWMGGKRGEKERGLTFRRCLAKNRVKWWPTAVLVFCTLRPAVSPTPFFCPLLLVARCGRAVNTSGGTYMDASPRALERVLWKARRTRVVRIDRIEEAHCWQTAVSPETPQSSAFQVSLISAADSRRSYQNCEPSLSLLLTSLLD